MLDAQAGFIGFCATTLPATPICSADRRFTPWLHSCCLLFVKQTDYIRARTYRQVS